MNKNIVIIAVVIVALLGGMYVLSMNKTPGDSMAPATQPTQSTEESQPDTTTEQPGESTTGEVKEINVEMGGFYFKPNEIKVKKGEKVKINFTNAGGIHDFVIDELNVKTNTLNTGEITSVEFTANEAGEFEFYCSIGNHRQQGMKGTLIVE